MTAAAQTKKKKPAARKPAGKKKGMPTKYSQAQVKLAYWVARNGKTNEEIAVALGIAVSTLYNWERRYPEFAGALNAGKQEPDDQVEQALFQRAIADTSPAGVTACIFWLKNRRPDRWRDRHELETTATVTVRQDVEDAIIKKLATDGGFAAGVGPVLAQYTPGNGKGGNGRKVATQN